MSLQERLCTVVILLACYSFSRICSFAKDLATANFVSDMFRARCVSFVCVIALVATRAKSLVPGMTSALYGDIAGHSDFELNLQPPEESTKDIQESLDALMKAEDIKSKASQADASSEKERMLEAEKVAIKEIVSTAFQPLLAKVKAQ